MEREDILENIERNFHLSKKEADIGLALLEERGKSLGFLRVEKYIESYYPLGFSTENEKPALSQEEKGFIRYLDSDARTLILTTQNSDFQAFLHASAASFRRQMSGEIKEKCEHIFGVADGKWTKEQIRNFVYGFEDYVNSRFTDADHEDIYERAKKFTEKIHVRLNVNRFETNQIVEIYDSLFTAKEFQFSEKEYHQQLEAIENATADKLVDKELYLGMTAPIYQSLGFERLPLVIDAESMQRLKKEAGDENFYLPFEIKSPKSICTRNLNALQIMSDKNPEKLLLELDIDGNKKVYFELTRTNKKNVLHLVDEKELKQNTEVIYTEEKEFNNPGLKTYLAMRIARIDYEISNMEAELEKEQSAYHEEDTKFNIVTDEKIEEQKDAEVEPELKERSNDVEAENETSTIQENTKPENLQTQDIGAENTESEISTEAIKQFNEKAINATDEQQLQIAFEMALYEKASVLKEIELSRENWNAYFPQGKIETPIETVKLGNNKFEKLQQPDRNYLLHAMYETLNSPHIILEKETFDERSEEFKPVQVYGKSFVRENSEQKKIVESIVVFKNDDGISIGTHNKDIERFVKQIKTADQIIYADKSISRLASLYLETGGNHVRLKGINTQVLNSSYSKVENLSSVEENKKVKTLPKTSQDEQASKQTVEIESDKALNAMPSIIMVNNTKIERVQIFFTEFPPAEQRAELKAHGWHWSPKNKSWQRKNTNNAIASANAFAKKFYPLIKKTEKKDTVEAFQAVPSDTEFKTDETKIVETTRSKDDFTFNKDNVKETESTSISETSLDENDEAQSKKEILDIRSRVKPIDQKELEELLEDANKPEIKKEIDNKKPQTQSEIKSIREKAKEILKKSNSEITEDDKIVLSQYEGAGGIYEENKTREGVLNEFYTPHNVIEKVWNIVEHYAPNAKTVLEPSAGIGKFAQNKKEKEFTMYEIDETSSRIAKLLHSNANVINEPYQKQFFDKDARVLNKNYVQPKYDVVIGNPPYGAYTGQWKGLGEGKEFSRYEEYFISKGLSALKDKNSVLAFVVPSSFLSSASDKQKAIIAEQGYLIDAYRLPIGTFNTTDVGTDILVMKKHPDAPLPEMIKSESEHLSNNDYFVEHPEKVLGEVKTRTNRFGDNEQYVAVHSGLTVQDELNKIDNFIESVNKKQSEIKIENKTHDAANQTVYTQAELFFSSDIVESSEKEKSTEVIHSQTKVQKSNFKTENVLSKEEFSALYGNIFNPYEFELLQKTQYDGSIPISKLSNDAVKYAQEKENYIRLNEKSFIHKENYCKGNVYELLEDLEKEKNELSESIYQERKALLKNRMPEPIPFDKMDIPVNSVFAQEAEPGKNNLQMQFIDWASGGNTWALPGYSPIGLDEFSSKVTWYDIVQYMQQVPVRAERAYTDEEREANKIFAEEKRVERKEVAEKLFKKFLNEGLTEQEKIKINKAYNKRFNGVLTPDYSKLPLFIDGMSKVKNGKEFRLYKQQLKGVSFLCNKGNSLLAYDVGVGKTACGIVATVNQIQTGRAKRPLICVPKTVYEKWLTDTKELFPNMQINDLGNFSKEKLKPFMIEEHGLNIAEGSISICTHEALQYISFKDSTLTNELRADIFDARKDLSGNISQRDRQLQKEKLEEILGTAAQVKGDFIYFENTGFDTITVDEAHRFKNLFTMPKPNSENNEKVANDFSGIAAGTPSKRAQKLFAITQIIQKENNGKGVFLLTATPFTNSPLEVYSMLSYVAREKLKDLHLYNLSTFMTEFAQTKTEWSVKASGEIIPKQVMKNFRKTRELQKILIDYIDKVDAEEAGVIRPKKFVKPVELEMSDLQKAIIDKETQRIESGDKNSAAALVAINNMRTAILSPALLTENYDFDLPPLKDIVKCSPKLKFVCDSVAECWKEKKDGGQVIYMPRGIDAFNYVKQYLVNKGVPEDVIEYINSKTNDEKKENIKNRFNDKNDKLKIIIGSETISEGIDLNGNSFALYNCMLGWNPTESLQVEGRIWRQGNNQSNVHIVYPVVADSVDSLMFQKHDEKASRIADLFSYKGADNELKVETINPEDLKFDLIKDIDKKVSFLIDQKIAPLKKLEFYINAKIRELSNVKNTFEYNASCLKQNICYDIEKTKKEQNHLAIKIKKLGIETDEKYETLMNKYEIEHDNVKAKIENIQKDKDAMKEKLKQDAHNNSHTYKSLDMLISENVKEIMSNLQSRDAKIIKTELSCKTSLNLVKQNKSSNNKAMEFER